VLCRFGAYFLKRGAIGIAKRLYSIEEAGIYLSRSAWTVADMARKGLFPYVLDGKRKFIDIRDLDKWIKANKKREEIKNKLFSTG